MHFTNRSRGHLSHMDQNVDRTGLVVVISMEFDFKYSFTSISLEGLAVKSVFLTGFDFRLMLGLPSQSSTLPTQEAFKSLNSCLNHPG